jgi:hypothetical protein
MARVDAAPGVVNDRRRPNEDPGSVMDQMGHTDAGFTMRVYRHSRWAAKAIWRGSRRPSPPAPGGRKARVSRASGSAPGTIRTCDLPLRRRTLYPLSYGRVRSG